MNKTFTKRAIAVLAMLATVTSLSACGKKEEASEAESSTTSIDAYSTDIKGNTKAESSVAPTTTTTVETTSEVPVKKEDDRLVPTGAKVSNDIPLGTVTFGSADYEFKSFDVDVTDCTLADLCEAYEKNTNNTYKLQPSENLVELDCENFYLCTQPFVYGGTSNCVVVEAMIDNKPITDDVEYYKSDNYASMEVKMFGFKRPVEKEDISFCGGEVSFDTPRADVETLLGAGKEFTYVTKDDRSITLTVYQNDTATLAIYYGNGNYTANKDCVESLYVFAN